MLQLTIRKNGTRHRLFIVFQVEYLVFRNYICQVNGRQMESVKFCVYPKVCCSIWEQLPLVPSGAFFMQKPKTQNLTDSICLPLT